jgi:hypothetical protein
MRLWVVTYEITSPDGLMLAEFYRGSRKECQRIEAASSVGEDDRRRTFDWKPMTGPAENWDCFVKQKVGSGEFVIVEGR